MAKVKKNLEKMTTAELNERKKELEQSISTEKGKIADLNEKISVCEKAIASYNSEISKIEKEKSFRTQNQLQAMFAAASMDMEEFLLAVETGDTKELASITQKLLNKPEAKPETAQQATQTTTNPNAQFNK